MNILVIETGWFEIAACDIQTRCGELLNMGGKSPIWTFSPTFSNSLHLVCRSQTAIPNQLVSGMRRHCATPNHYLHSSKEALSVNTSTKAKWELGMPIQVKMGCPLKWLEGEHWSGYRVYIRSQYYLSQRLHEAHWRDYGAPWTWLYGAHWRNRGALIKVMTGIARVLN